MATVVFFEKPSCAGNARQKQMLIRAGHRVEAHNLLTTSWTPERLLSFFGDLPVSDWFNPAAVRVKSGEIDRQRIEADTALALLVAEPQLIRRPLLEIDGVRLVGFDVQRLRALIGLEGGEDVVTISCRGSHEGQGCSGGSH